MPPLKIVVDTSVLVAAFFNSRSSSLVESWNKGEYIFCVSRSIIREYKAILLKIPPIRDTSQAFLDRLLHHSSTFLVDQPPSIDIQIEDSEDRKFIECAAEVNADYVISLDDHLLRLKNYANIPIVRPGEFLDRIEPFSQESQNAT